MHKSLPSLLLLLTLSTALPCAAQDYYADFTPKSFRNLPEVQARIDPENFNEPLAAAAVFHETNVRRAKKKLSIVKPDEKARVAALEHSQAMAEGGYLSHGEVPAGQDPTEANLKKADSTPYKRMVAQGLDPMYASENVARTFALDYKSGRKFFTREEGGEVIHSYKADGKALEYHNYASFAEALVDDWMDSPAHRVNILAKQAKFLGVGLAYKKADARTGLDEVYSTQNFYAPVPEGAQVVRPE